MKYPDLDNDWLAERTIHEISRIARRVLHHVRRRDGHLHARYPDLGWALCGHA